MLKFVAWSLAGASQMLFSLAGNERKIAARIDTRQDQRLQEFLSAKNPYITRKDEEK